MQGKNKYAYLIEISKPSTGFRTLSSFAFSSRAKALDNVFELRCIYSEIDNISLYDVDKVFRFTILKFELH